MIRVVAGVIVRDERLLIARRLPGAHQGGLWEFPGGKVEPGEPETIALRRELREELGIEATVGRRVDRRLHRYPDGRAIAISFYACRPLGGEAVPLGSAQLAWVRAADLVARDFPAANRAVVGRLRRLPALETLFLPASGPRGRGSRAPR